MSAVKWQCLSERHCDGWKSKTDGTRNCSGADAWYVVGALNLAADSNIKIGKWEAAAKCLVQISSLRRSHVGAAHIYASCQAKECHSA